MERKTYQYREVIFKQGEYQNWMYSICQGSVDIYTEYGTADEKKLITLTAGRFFGEIGMIALIPRTATAVAAEDHVMLELISNENFADYLNNHPENIQPIMSSVSGRLRELTEDLSMITQMTNEALRARENGNKEAGLLAKLLGKLKAKKAAGNDFTNLRKRQQALSGEIPPVINFKAGDVIFRAGEQADCMYEVYDGIVGIYSDYQTENAKLLAKLSADSVFGEMGILDDMPRSATAVCLTNCALLVVKPENFMAFFRDKPLKILQNLQQMCFQLRNLTETYLQVCRTLEEVPSPDDKDFREEEVFAKLEYIRQTQLCISMYDATGNCWYDYF